MRHSTAIRSGERGKDEGYDDSRDANKTIDLPFTIVLHISAFASTVSVGVL
jgi:hypothetical protein